VVDLLVAMARAAVQSTRKKLIFEPYPSVVDPKDKDRLAFTPEVCCWNFTTFSQIL